MREKKLPNNTQQNTKLQIDREFTGTSYGARNYYIINYITFIFI